MKLTTLIEHPAWPPKRAKASDQALVQQLDAAGWDHGDEYVIEDGIVTQAPGALIGDVHLTVPPSWSRFPAKFGAFPDVGLSCVRGKLTTLENAPTEVKSMVLQAFTTLATLRGGPSIVHDNVVLTDLGLTTLAGFPSVVGGSVFLRKLEHITNLEGIPPSLEVKGAFEIYDCALTSFAGMPSVNGAIVIGDSSMLSTDELPIIKFPKGFRMNGKLLIGSRMAQKLSPTLALIPGLTEVDWATSGYRHDILKIFNEHLKMPKNADTYFRLQQALIENDLEELAVL